VPFLQSVVAFTVIVVGRKDHDEDDYNIRPSLMSAVEVEEYRSRYCGTLHICAWADVLSKALPAFLGLMMGSQLNE
jgi:hypothetical protein